MNTTTSKDFILFDNIEGTGLRVFHFDDSLVIYNLQENLELFANWNYSS